MKLKQRILDKISDLGPKRASEFFGVSLGTVSNWSTGKTSPSIDALELVIADGGAEWTLDDIKPDPEPPKPELVSWEGKDVIILQPAYRSISPDTHFTLFANYAKYGPDKLGLIQEKRTVIHEARNILADKFLNKTTASTAIMVDDDMILPCGNIALFNDRYGANINATSASYNAISRIMSHDSEKGIVGSLYFGRHSAGKAQCCKGFTSEQENQKLRDGHYAGLVPDEWVGAGFIRIQRWVFEKMKAEIDKGRWPECAPQGNDGWYGYFTPQRVRMGEDVSFGRRAAEIGIQTYVDAGLVSLHIGECFYGPRNTKG